MKKIISLLLMLIMLTAAACARAGEKSCVITAVIQAGDQEIRADLNFFTQEDHRVLLTTSLVQDLCVLFPEVDAEEAVNELAELVRTLSDGKTTEIIGKCVTEWLAFMQPETWTGSFSGDAFERASVVQQTTFSYGDLMLLADRIREELQANGIDGVLTDSGLPKLLMPERNILFDLKVFDGGQYFSLGVIDGGNTVATVSANVSQRDSILLVTGCGFGGKNYYSCMKAEIKESRLDVTETLHADDMKTGYPGLTEDSLICTRDMTIEWTAEEVRFVAGLAPANGMASIIASGTLRSAETGRIFEGEVHFVGYDGIRATITADLKDGGIGKMPARVIDIDKADDTQLVALGTEIGVALLPSLFQIISALPPEYSAPMLQLMSN